MNVSISQSSAEKFAEDYFVRSRQTVNVSDIARAHYCGQEYILSKIRSDKVIDNPMHIRIFCMHCSCFVDYGLEGMMSEEEAYKMMTNHEKECDKNPLVVELKKMKDEINQLISSRKNLLEFLKDGLEKEYESLISNCDKHTSSTNLFYKCLEILFDQNRTMKLG